MNPDSASISDPVSIIYISPNGEEESDPKYETILSALMSAGKSYWEAGSGDASLRFKMGSRMKGEIIIMVRDPYGVFVQFTDLQTSQEFVLRNCEDDNAEIVIQQGGDPWKLPRRFFVSRETANRGVAYFMEHGERAPDLQWERF